MIFVRQLFLLCEYKHCGKADCECCETVMEILSHEKVKKYTRKKKF
jgi:hypothetical protein